MRSRINRVYIIAFAILLEYSVLYGTVLYIIYYLNANEVYFTCIHFFRIINYFNFY